MGREAHRYHETAVTQAEARKDFFTLFFGEVRAEAEQAQAALDTALLAYARGEADEAEIGRALNVFFDAHRTVWHGGIGRPFRRKGR